MRRSLLACTFSSAARSSVTSGSTGTRRLAERDAAAGRGALELMFDDLRHAIDLELDGRAPMRRSLASALPRLARITASGVFRLCARLPSVSR